MGLLGQRFYWHWFSATYDGQLGKNFGHSLIYKDERDEQSEMTFGERPDFRSVLQHMVLNL